MSAGQGGGGRRRVSNRGRGGGRAGRGGAGRGGAGRGGAGRWRERGWAFEIYYYYYTSRMPQAHPKPGAPFCTATSAAQAAAAAAAAQAQPRPSGARTDAVGAGPRARHQRVGVDLVREDAVHVPPHVLPRRPVHPKGVVALVEGGVQVRLGRHRVLVAVARAPVGPAPLVALGAQPRDAAGVLHPLGGVPVLGVPPQVGPGLAQGQQRRHLQGLRGQRAGALVDAAEEGRRGAGGAAHGQTPFRCGWGAEAALRRAGARSARRARRAPAHKLPPSRLT
jgi:hypothetical protein